MGLYVSFVGLYVSFVGLYVSFVGLYVSFVGLYVSFVEPKSFGGCVQPIADRAAQHLEIISKNFQVSTRRTRILMGCTI